MFVLTGAYVVCVACCWSNIVLAGRIMEAASQFVSSNKKILFTPLVSYFNILWFGALWLTCAVFLYSVGPPVFVRGYYVADVYMDDRTFYMMWYFLFCLLWTVAFINGCQKFLIASCTAMWFFDKNNDGDKEADISTALTWTYWYNVGSVAFGSLLIAIVQFIRIVFEYID